MREQICLFQLYYLLLNISGSSDDLDPTLHAKSLAKLRDTDPEFYAYLEENDKKLLNFQLDSDASDGEPSEGEEEEDEKNAAHKPDADLHEASDESDFEVCLLLLLLLFFWENDFITEEDNIDNSQ